MKSVIFEPRSMDQILSAPEESTTEWIWQGFLARGNLTLLTSQWKAGKTTLLAGLLQSLEGGGTFLDKPCIAAKSLVISEETTRHWAVRQKTIPIGTHTRLVSRPFIGRPTADQWDELIRHAEVERAAGELDLLVVDPLVTFLPGRSDSDPGTLLDMLNPLRRIAESGAAVLILHHPRKKPADQGDAARGSGVLLGFVDIILELKRCGRLETDFYRRSIAGLSRHLETPAELVYEWSPEKPQFRAEPELHATRCVENWPLLKAILADQDLALTHKELLGVWPVAVPPPTASQLYHWLTTFMDCGEVIRTGSGVRGNPYRWRLRTSKVARPPGALRDVPQSSPGDSPT